MWVIRGVTRELLDGIRPQKGKHPRNCGVRVRENFQLTVLLITMAASSGKRNVTVWRPSVRLSVRMSRRHTHRDSPGGSMRRGQRAFRPDNKDDRHKLVVVLNSGGLLFRHGRSSHQLLS